MGTRKRTLTYVYAPRINAFVPFMLFRYPEWLIRKGETVMPESQDLQKCWWCHFASEREEKFRECPECHNTICHGCWSPFAHMCKECHRCKELQELRDAFDGGLKPCPKCCRTICESCKTDCLTLCPDCCRTVNLQFSSGALPENSEAGAPGSPTFPEVTREQRVHHAIELERGRQISMWGDQQHTHEHWLSILTEEVGEVARALNDDKDKDEIRKELVQVAAVAVAWLEDGYRKTGEGKTTCVGVAIGSDICRSLQT